MSAVLGAESLRRMAVWPVLLVVLVVSLLLWPTMPIIAGKWQPISDNVMSHAWLVVAVVVWGVFTEAKGFVSGAAAPAMLLPPRSLSPRLLPTRFLPTIVTLALSLFWALTVHAALLVPQQLLWLAIVFSCLWSVLGTAAMRELLRPMWILILLMPIWSLPHAFLWFASAKAVKAMLAMLGVPAYFEGNTIHLASGAIEIAAGCAGLAFFAAALAIAAIIGYMNRASFKQHLVLLGVAGLVAMVCNWLRIVIIVFEAHRTQMQTYLITTDHYVFGWVLFAIGLMGFCLLFARYGQASEASRPAVITQFTPLRLLIGVASVALGPVALALSTPKIVSSDFPISTQSLPGFRHVTADGARWYPQFPGADASELLQREDGPATELVYGNVFFSQTNDRRLIGDGHSVLPSESWEARSATTSDDHTDVLAADLIGNAWLIRYSYRSRDWATPNALQAQLRYGLQQFFSDPPIGILAVAVRCADECTPAQRARLDAAWTPAKAWYVESFFATRH